MKLKIKRIHPDAKLPERANTKDSGLDLRSVENVLIYPQQIKLVHTGIKIELPEGTEAQVRPRSGLALKHKITVLNTPGTVDEGYSGEICVILFNVSHELDKPFEIKVGDRIAQLVIAPVLRPEIEEVDELSDSERGENGFGSSGVK